MPPRLDSPTASNTNAFDYRDDCSDSGEDPVSPPSPRSQGSRASSSSSASSTKSEIEFKAVPYSSTSAVEDLAVPGEFLEAHVVSNVCLGKSLSKEPQEDVYLEKAYSLFTKANELRLGNPNVTQTTVVQFISPLAMLNPANSKDTTMSAVLQNLQNKKVLDCTLKNVTVSDVKGADTNCLTKKTEITFLTPDNKTLSITLLEMAPDFRRQLLNKQTIAETVKHLEGHDPTCLLSFAGQGRSSIMASVLQLREAMKELKDGGGGALSQRQIVGLLNQKIEHIEQHRPKYLSLSQEVQLRQKDAIIEYLVDYAKELWPAPQAQQRPRRGVRFVPETKGSATETAGAATHRADSAAPSPAPMVGKGLGLPNLRNTCFLNATLSCAHNLLGSELKTTLRETGQWLGSKVSLCSQLNELATKSKGVVKFTDSPDVRKFLEKRLIDTFLEIISKYKRDQKTKEVCRDFPELFKLWEAGDNLGVASEYFANNKSNPFAKMDYEDKEKAYREVKEQVLKKCGEEFVSHFIEGVSVDTKYLDTKKEFWGQVEHYFDTELKRSQFERGVVHSYANALDQYQKGHDPATRDEKKLSDALQQSADAFRDLVRVGASPARLGKIGAAKNSQESASELLNKLMALNEDAKQAMNSSLCWSRNSNARNPPEVDERSFLLQTLESATANRGDLDQIFKWDNSSVNGGAVDFSLKKLNAMFTLPRGIKSADLKDKNFMVALEGASDRERPLKFKIDFDPLKDRLEVAVEGGASVAVFEPVGVVVHCGRTANSGHYYSFINHGRANSPAWQKYDDSVVTSHTLDGSNWFAAPVNTNERPTFMFYRFAGFQPVQQPPAS
jgi:hypothetical protein